MSEQTETTEPKIELGTHAIKIAILDHLLTPAAERPACFPEAGVYFHFPQLDEETDAEVIIYGPYPSIEVANEEAIDVLTEAWSDVAKANLGLVEAEFVGEGE